MSSTSDNNNSTTQQPEQQVDWRKEGEDFLALAQCAVQAGNNPNAAVQEVGRKQWQELKRKMASEFAMQSGNKCAIEPSNEPSKKKQKKEKDPNGRKWDALRIGYVIFTALSEDKFDQTLFNKYWKLVVDGSMPWQRRVRSALVACGLMEEGKKSTTNKMHKEELQAQIGAVLDQFRQLCADDIALYERSQGSLDKFGEIEDEIRVALRELPATVAAQDTSSAHATVAAPVTAEPVAAPVTAEPVAAPVTAPVTAPNSAPVSAPVLTPVAAPNPQLAAALAMQQAQPQQMVVPSALVDTQEQHKNDDFDSSSHSSDDSDSGSDSDNDLEDEATQAIQMECAEHLTE